MKKTKNSSHLLAGLRSNALIGVLFAVLVVAIILLFVNLFTPIPSPTMTKSTSPMPVNCGYCHSV